MAADKDAAKRRRQARNRQERSKRQDRVEGARRAESRPARTADAVASSGKSRAKGGAVRSRASATEEDQTAPSGGATRSSPQPAGGLLGKLFPPRPDAGTGSGGRPSRAQPKESVIVDAGEAGETGGLRGWLAIRMSQPGGRPVLLALFVSIVSAVTLLAFPVLPRFAFEYYGETVVEASAVNAGETGAAAEAMIETFNEGDTISAGASRLLEVAPLGYALVFSLIPVVICGLAVSSLTRPTRSRTLLISALAAALYVFFSQGIGTFFILGVAALGWGAYKSRKADALAVAEAD